jgi:hypothetical protein
MGRFTAFPIEKKIVSTKKPPVKRGFLGRGIIPTGELKPCEDQGNVVEVTWIIIPTGELKPREDML